MQVTGTFPELSAGRSKGSAKKPAMRPAKAAGKGGFSGFSIKGKGREGPVNAPTYAGRRAAAHRKGSGE